MKVLYTSGLILLFALKPTIVAAYEPGTHQQIADAAASSILTADLFKDWGFDPAQQLPSGDAAKQCIYLGIDRSTSECGSFKANDTGDFRYLIQVGAALEDHDNRSLCHFFDPLKKNNASGALHFGVDADFSAMDWAVTASTSDYCWLGIFRSDDAQQYSFPSINDDFYHALTSGLQADRDDQFGKLFLALGHEMHLLQDMAQPQHVRNDVHCDDPICKLFREYHPSGYEAWVFNHPYSYAGVTRDFSGEQNLKAQDFWHTDDKKGLADFTNENFVSVGTLDGFLGLNPTPKYTSPTWDNPNETPVAIDDVVAYEELIASPPEVTPHCTPSAPCQVWNYQSVGRDHYDDSQLVNPYAVSESLYDSDLQDNGFASHFSLNGINYEAAKDILIPRAIGYSEGLLKYVFRGKLDAHLDIADPNMPNTLNFRVTNMSNFAFSNGNLEVYYDDAQGKRHPISTQPVNLDPHCTGSCDDSVSIALPTLIDPPMANPGRYMFVYRGKIGTEDGVAAYTNAPSNYLYEMLDYQGYSPSSHGLAGGNVVEILDNTGKVFSNTYVGDNELTCDFATDEYCDSPAYMTAFDHQIFVAWPSGVNAFNDPYLAQGFDFDPILTIGPDCAESIGGIASNHYGIYVYYSITASCSVHGLGAGTYVDHFDFKGNLIDTFAVSNTVIGPFPGGGPNQISANDARLCFPNPSGSTLTDLHGAVVASLVGAIGCASTANRHYVLASGRGPDGTSTGEIDVYDNYGVHVDSFTVNATEQDLTWITANDDKIYITGVAFPYPAMTQVIKVENRIVTHNSDGTIASESFVTGSDIQVPYPAFASDISVDMADVLGAPSQ